MREGVREGVREGREGGREGGRWREAREQKDSEREETGKGRII